MFSAAATYPVGQKAAVELKAKSLIALRTQSLLSLCICLTISIL